MSCKTQSSKTFAEEIKRFNLEKRAAKVVNEAVKYFQKNPFELQVELEVPHKLHDFVENVAGNKPVAVSRLMFNMNRLRFTSIVQMNSFVCGKRVGPK